ncbi:hypothetical protein BGZ63DRAFT_421378 [Mariannaea sp. PMI_226]|nr:hypothetical protein BGZ63DRAFT_421378 [Mariannaea sp. PMI_226]
MPRYLTQTSPGSRASPFPTRDLRKTVSFNFDIGSENEENSDYEFHSQTSSICGRARRLRKSKSESFLGLEFEESETDSGAPDHSTTTSINNERLRTPDQQNTQAYRDEENLQQPLFSDTSSVNSGPGESVGDPFYQPVDKAMNRTAIRMIEAKSKAGPSVEASRSVDAQGLYPPSACIFVAKYFYGYYTSNESNIVLPASLPIDQSDTTLMIEVKKAFSIYGRVHVKIKRDRKKRPVAFCQFEHATEAARALANGNQRLIMGRPCRTEKCKANVTFLVCRRDYQKTTIEEAHSFLAPFGAIAKVEVMDKLTQGFLGLSNQAIIVTYEMFDSHRNIEQDTNLDPDLYAMAFDPEEASWVRTLDDDHNKFMETYQRDIRSVFIGSIPEFADSGWVRTTVQKHAPVLRVEMKQCALPNANPTSFCYVEFGDMFIPQAVVNSLDGKVIDKCTLRCERRKFKLPSVAPRDAMAGSTVQYGNPFAGGFSYSSYPATPMPGSYTSQYPRSSTTGYDTAIPASSENISAGSTVVKMCGAAGPTTFQYQYPSTITPAHRSFTTIPLHSTTAATSSTMTQATGSISQHSTSSVIGHPQRSFQTAQPSGTSTCASVAGQSHSTLMTEPSRAPMIHSTQVYGYSKQPSNNDNGHRSFSAADSTYAPPATPRLRPAALATPTPSAFQHPEVSVGHYSQPSTAAMPMPGPLTAAPVYGTSTATPMSSASMATPMPNTYTVTPTTYPSTMIQTHRPPVETTIPATATTTSMYGIATPMSVSSTAMHVQTSAGMPAAPHPHMYPMDTPSALPRGASNHTQQAHANSQTAYHSHSHGRRRAIAFAQHPVVQNTTVPVTDQANPGLQVSSYFYQEHVPVPQTSTRRVTHLCPTQANVSQTSAGGPVTGQPDV